MAVVINTVGTEYFTINGVRYARIFQPLTTEIGKVGIYNAYDTRQQLLPQTPFYELTIDAVVPISVTEAAELLLPVIWAYNGSGGGIGTLDWGNITGLLSNQTDLVAEFTTKSDVGHTHLHTDITDFDTELAGTSNITAFTPTLDYHPATKKYVFDEDELQREILSTGISDGGEISINVDTTKFDIAAGTGFVVDHTVHPSVVTKVEWSAFTAQSVTDIATQSATDLAIDEGGSIVQQLSFTEEEKRSLIFLGGLSHLDNINIDRTFPLNIMSDGIGSNLYELSQAIGDINTSGNVFFPNVGGNLSIDKTAGTTFSYGRNNTINKDAPNALSQGSQTICNILRVFDDGTGNGSFSFATTVDPTKYDDGSGTLVTLTGGKWSIQRVLMFSNSGQVVVQYGNDQYVNKADAITNATLTSFASLAGFKTAIVRGYIIMKNTVTDLTTSDAEFVVADRFGGVSSRDSGSTGSVAWGSITGTLSAQTDLQAALDLKADLSGDIFTGDISVPTEVYGVGWSASAEVPTKGDLYTKIETLGGGGSIGGTIASTQLAYGSGVDTIAGSADLTWAASVLGVVGGVEALYLGTDRGSSLSDDGMTVFTAVGATGSSILTASNTTGSTGFPSVTGQGLYVKGASSPRDFAFWRTASTINDGLWYGNKNSANTAWEWFQIFHENTNSPTWDGGTADNNWVIESTAGVSLHLKADSDNVTETDNVHILMSQDGGIKSCQFGLTGATNVPFTGTASNDTYFMNQTAAEDYHFGFDGATRSSLIVDNGRAGIYAGEVLSDGSIATEHSAKCGFVLSPEGAFFSATTSAYTGAFRITLPSVPTGTSGNSADMIIFDVSIYDYAGGDGQGEAIKMTISGYPNASGWANTAVVTHSKRTDKDYNVRFYYDATSHYVYIGETSSAWSYPQVTVNNLQVGYNAVTTEWLTGWSIDASVLAFTGTLDHTSSDNYPTAGRMRTADNVVVQDSTDRAGLLEIGSTTAHAWHGIQIKDNGGQLWSLMGDDNDFAIYDDTNGKFHLICNENAGVDIYHNASIKCKTTSVGITVTGDGTATDWNATSDERLKEDIKPLGEYPITTNWVSYKWKDGGKEDIGLIAQDLEKTNPEFVKHDDEGIKSISYTKVLIAKMAEKDRQIQDLTNRLTKIEKMLCQ